MTEKWVNCSRCKSTFPYRYVKNGCPVCGNPIQKDEIFEKESV